MVSFQYSCDSKALIDLIKIQGKITKSKMLFMFG